ncbi:9944_t:CDS:2 [Acaulospora morrowiae]|uniref:9944_t:CDS:1 n=1 Tax=Acaulospora morrowiae TaxID=94023 RepID=A0A9N9G7E8_9GLOM|nr:9944_t:CDS:2 [Acaulospora morrowiae]
MSSTTVPVLNLNFELSGIYERQPYRLLWEDNIKIIVVKTLAISSDSHDLQLTKCILPFLIFFNPDDSATNVPSYGSVDSPMYGPVYGSIIKISQFMNVNLLPRTLARPFPASSRSDREYQPNPKIALARPKDLKHQANLKITCAVHGSTRKLSTTSFSILLAKLRTKVTFYQSLKQLQLTRVKESKNIPLFLKYSCREDIHA